MRTLAACLVCALASPCVAQVGQGSEQETNPAPALVKALGSKKITDQLRAERRLRKLGRAAVPALLKGLQKEAPGTKHGDRILRTLGLMRRDAAAALPALLELLRRAEGTSVAVLEAVDRIAPYDPDNTEEVIKALGEAWMNRAVARGAVRRLRRLPSRAVVRSRNRLGVDCKTSTKKLLELIKGGNSVEREIAAELIVEAAGEKQEKIAALRECFGRPKKRESMRARFSAPGRSSSISTSLDNYAGEQLAVASALLVLCSTKDVPAGAWVVLLRHEDSNTVRRSILALAAQPSRPTARALLALVDHKDRTIAWEAITVLGMMGDAARIAVTRLSELSKKEDDKATAARAKAALQSIRRALEQSLEKKTAEKKASSKKTTEEKAAQKKVSSKRVGAGKTGKE